LAISRQKICAFFKNFKKSFFAAFPGLLPGQRQPKRLRIFQKFI
ncbi:hypothetical protein T11_3052, partial [Trichinella zimbabwensis]